MGPLPHETRQEVRELRQFHLELPLARPRALGEDVENQRGAIDDPHSDRPHQVALLDRCQRVVGDEERGPETAGERGDLVHLPPPEVERGGWRAALLHHRGENLGAGGLREPGQLLHRLVHLPPTLADKPQSRQDGPVGGSVLFA